MAFPLGSNQMSITSSRVMLFGSFLEGPRGNDEVIWRVIVWDWKTRDRVGLLQFDGSQFVHLTSSGTRTFIHG